jgi:quinol monooxygenase YgiN
MTVLTLLEAKIKPQRANDLARLLRELLPSTSSFAGCKSVAAHLSEDGASFLLVEHWDSKEAQQKYATWRTTTDHGKQLGSDRTIGAIKEVLEGQALPMPRNWGAFFLHFPTGGEWHLPSTGWHLDGNYAGRLSPPCGILIHAMLNDVGPRCGGMNIVSASHRLVHKWFTDNPPAHGARSAKLRKSLQRHPYIRDLCTAGNSAERIVRFHERVETVDGMPLQVVENTASAGDLILMHSLLLHAIPAAHVGTQPRFVLSTGIQDPYWESGSTQ